MDQKEAIKVLAEFLRMMHEHDDFCLDQPGANACPLVALSVISANEARASKTAGLSSPTLQEGALWW